MDEPVLKVSTRQVTGYLRSLSEEELRELYHLCGSWAAVAKRYGVESKTVRALIAQRGVEWRDIPGRKRYGLKSRKKTRKEMKNYLTLADLHQADPGEFERWFEEICRGMPLRALGVPPSRRVKNNSVRLAY